MGLTLLAGGCASTGAVPQPFPLAGARPPATTPDTPATAGAAPLAAPTPIPTRPRNADGYALTSTALGLRGIHYRNGGSDPAFGFDCSGFTQYVFSQNGVSLPREVRDQYQSGKKVKPENVVAGDLLFFSTTAPGPTHVGISLGGDEFIHAPSSTGVVRVERVTATYWSQRFLEARRVN